jgi:hypothetical protein
MITLTRSKTIPIRFRQPKRLSVTCPTGMLREDQVGWVGGFEMTGWLEIRGIDDRIFHSEFVPMMNELWLSKVPYY